ncbi:MAG: hypothetical protein QM759_01085 [Terricaulis sp.]
MGTLKAILIGGLIAGVLDIGYAFAVYGPLAASLGLSSALTPMEVLQSVAGGWMGRDAAMAGGQTAAIIGACTHFGIALVMAGVFVLVFGRVAASNWVAWGLIYGVILFVVMNYVVVPLSAAADGHFVANLADGKARIQSAVERALQFKRPLLLAGTVFTHTILVGLPIAWANSKFAQHD